MMKRILSLMLCMVLIVGIIPISADAADTAVVSVSLGIEGELALDKNGKVLANREITLSGKDSYTVDDAIYALHTLYHPEGESAYGTDVSTSDWGTYSYITKLWGDESTKFGYQVNGGEVSTTLDTPMVDGDTLDVCIYENFYPETEDYTKFDIRSAEVVEGESVFLTLNYCSGYDEETFAMIFSPLEGATITIDGEDTEIVTDAEGNAEISIEEAGEYVISAKMTKKIEQENASPKTVGAITPPVCTLKVTMSPENQLLHGIAGAYLKDGILNSGSNLPWIVADLAVYSELYPTSENVFSKNLRQACLDKLVASAPGMEMPGDLAKTIIAISALGYDASVVYTSSGAELKLVEKLTALVDAKDEAVTNMYTLPYVIIALGDFATDEQMNYLVNSAVSTKADWLKVEDMGTDALTPMIFALAPYDSAQGAIADAVAVLKEEQREDGLIDGFPGYESASTALAICALSAIGIDAAEITKGGKNLVEGLISDANEDKDALSNEFATEQGFRALLAMKMQGKCVYDFSDFPKNEARATRVSIGGGGGSSSKPSVKPEEPEEIPEEKPEISFPDVNKDDWYYEAVSFVCNEGLFNGTASGFEPNGKMTRAMLVTVLYRLGGEKKGASSFSDVKNDAWYYDAVNWAYDTGIVMGVNETTFAPDENVTREQLATILYRFAIAEGEDVKDSDISGFADADKVSSYAKEAFFWAVGSGIVTGKGENTLAPSDTATRAEVATMLMRYVSK